MIQELEKEIRSKLPHLMELSAGCEIEHIDGRRMIFDNSYTLQDNGNITHKHYFSFNYPKDTYTTIGHPITLPNVLEWLKGLGKDYAIKSNGELMVYEVNFGKGNWRLLNIWFDLSKKLLRDQSTELIDSLFNLK